MSIDFYSRLDEEQLPSFTQRLTLWQTWLTQSMWITHSRMLCSLPRSCLVHPVESFWQWRVVQLWPGDIFNCVSCFLVKKHAAFKWKDAISGFPVSQGSAEALVMCAGKINHIFIAYFLGNIYAKKCRSQTVYVKIIGSCKGGTFFLRHSVDNKSHLGKNYARCTCASFDLWWTSCCCILTTQWSSSLLVIRQQSVP